MNANDNYASDCNEYASFRCENLAASFVGIVKLRKWQKQQQLTSASGFKMKPTLGNWRSFDGTNPIWDSCASLKLHIPSVRAPLESWCVALQKSSIPINNGVLAAAMHDTFAALPPIENASLSLVSIFVSRDGSIKATLLWAAKQPYWLATFNNADV